MLNPLWTTCMEVINTTSQARRQFNSGPVSADTGPLLSRRFAAAGGFPGGVGVAFRTDVVSCFIQLLSLHSHRDNGSGNIKAEHGIWSQAPHPPDSTLVLFPAYLGTACDPPGALWRTASRTTHPG